MLRILDILMRSGLLEQAIHEERSYVTHVGTTDSKNTVLFCGEKYLVSSG